MEQWNHIKLREKAIATGKLLLFVFLDQQRGLESIICLVMFLEYRCPR